MGKVVGIALGLMMISSFALFAATNNSQAKVEMLINDGLFKNVNAISAASLNLTDSQRVMIFDEHKKDAIMPFVLNLLLPIPVGSYVQGDSTGGTIALIGELGGLAVVIAGVLVEAGSVSSLSSTGSISIGGLLIATLGAVVLGGFHIYSLIRPFGYTSNYNKTLRRALYSKSVADKTPKIYANIASKQSGGLSFGLGLRFML